MGILFMDSYLLWYWYSLWDTHCHNTFIPMKKSKKITNLQRENVKLKVELEFLQWEVDFYKENLNLFMNSKQNGQNPNTPE